MFYEIEIKSHIRVPPTLFNEDTNKSILSQLNDQFENYISKELGIVIAVSEIVNIGDGVIIPGDGAAYYGTTFKLLTFKPELHEVVLGTISDITDFGAFVNIGPIEGMVHISQTMDDYVNFSKSNVLTGKESKRTLKIKDQCRARIIAISYKSLHDPKIGLTMRQHLLGNINYIEKELKKQKKK
ncbi:DNA-directed RNA polymerase [archaeon]|nr:DNA-directed RNA polymerase [archaeon]